MKVILPITRHVRDQPQSWLGSPVLNPTALVLLIFSATVQRKRISRTVLASIA